MRVAQAIEAVHVAALAGSCPVRASKPITLLVSL